MILTPEILQLGGLFIISYYLVELVKYIVGRYTNKGNGINQAILEQLQTQNTNHLHTINEGMEKGFDKLDATIKCGTDILREGNTQIIALLSEIKGNLRR